MSVSVFRSIVPVILLSAACSGSTGPTEPVAARLGMATEPSAEASSGVPLPTQPVVQVLDVNGAVVAARGVLVTVTIASGTGTLAGETGVRTDASGRAAFTDLALAGPVGQRTLRFSAQGLSAVISRQVTVGAGPAAAAAVHAGNNQTAAAGTAVTQAPAVRVTDGSGNPVPGIQVTFAVTAGNGTIAGATPVTNAQGIATVGQWTLGTGIGVNSLSATVAGLGASAVLFSATAVVGPAAQLTLVEGDGQSATIGMAVATAPAVRVADAFGNPVPGLAITFSVSAGSGSVTGATAASDAGGVARVGSWRLGFVPGINALSATRAGVPPVTFNATAVDLSVLSIAPGALHSCAAGTDGLTRCWGDNTQGQLGNGATSPDSVAVTVTTNQVFTQVGTGSAHSCGLTAAGAAWCWGVNTNGQLGNGTTFNSTVPVPVSGGLVFTQLSVGLLHSCALSTDGTAWCWGIGANGRLGDGLQLSRVSPVAVGGGHTYSQISAGGSHTCGRRTDGTVLCWGAGASGRIGDGFTLDRPVPTAVSGAGLYTSVEAGGGHSCALDATGAAWCWGVNASGQVGDATNTQRNVPTPVQGGRTWIGISTGNAHTCAVTSLFEAYCWGENAGGRLGDGTATDRNLPTAAGGGLSYAVVRAGEQHTCARSTSGSAICWGTNSAGQLGDKSTTNRLTPVGVVRP